ncbi:fimbria/pilus outer membrane usher protein, partial [Escherichia coli]|nr:fimbria/pilus outer membrane usher protein [Escherichia coli]MCN8527511.1 fimbria/pilus outer membrane usher protein [Escherichia coli]
MQTTRTPYSVSFMATVLLLLLFACHSTIANAAVALGATRVIYPANQKQVLLPVTNNDPASVYRKSFYQTGTNIQVAGYRYSTQGFYNLSDSAYSRMSGYTVKPPTGDTSEQTLFIDYFNLFYSKRGQEQISISQQLGNYGTTFFSTSRQSYWNTSRSRL